MSLLQNIRNFFTGEYRALVPQVVWTLADALTVVRNTEIALAPFNAHVALAGGVLQHGYSYKDLDIIIYPSKTSKEYSWFAMKEQLMRCGVTFGVYPCADHNKYGDNKFVCVGHLDGKRIDFIVLECK